MEKNERVRVMIVDDNPYDVLLLRKMVEKTPPLEVVATTNDPFMARTILLSEQIDLVFVDVEMEELDGLELLESLPSPPLAIVHTAYDRFAVRTYDMNMVVDYLMKDRNYPRFVRAVQRALERLGHADLALQIKGEPVSDNYLFLLGENDDQGRVRVSLSDVLYMEAQRNYVYVYTLKGLFKTRETMANFVKNFPDDALLQTHRSFWVKKAFILGEKTKEGKRVVILTEETNHIPLSKSFVAGFEQFFNQKK